MKSPEIQALAQLLNRIPMTIAEQLWCQALVERLEREVAEQAEQAEQAKQAGRSAGP